ncbi:MAG: hypothetical protein JST91_13280 [Actinobacteria bacterium]|nr:hypothetical protein [Actinomycetota bacterium]
MWHREAARVARDDAAAALSATEFLRTLHAAGEHPMVDRMLADAELAVAGYPEARSV